jgi:predicted ester cyclase
MYRVRWTMRGTHLGEFLGVPATGRAVTLTTISIVRMENGRIIDGWRESDRLKLLQQFGAVDERFGRDAAGQPFRRA